MMSTLRANTAAKPESLTAASACARRWGKAVVAGFDYVNFMSILPSEDHQPQLRSVPLCTPAAAIYGEHPGTEEWVDHCDADHTNFIIPGRHVA